MKRIITVLSIVIILFSCSEKKLSLDELDKAKWNNLSPGIEYLDRKQEKGISQKTDSIEFKLIGVRAIESKVPLEMTSTDFSGETHLLLKTALQGKLQDSKYGYLKINFDELMRPSFRHGMIYIKSDYSQTSFNVDSASIKNLTGIVSVKFISKEAAKKEYLDSGNSDWDKVLTDNPLPNTIEITLDGREWTAKSLDNLKAEIRTKIVNADEITFPSVLSRESKDYFYYEYRRK